MDIESADTKFLYTKEEIEELEEYDDKYDCPIYGLQDSSDCPLC